MIRSYRPLFGPVTIVAVWHIGGGVAALFAPQAAFVSALSGIAAPPAPLALTLILAGSLALWARFRTDPYATALLVPQQIVLFLQGYGVIVALIEAHYPDGYIPVVGNPTASRLFIFGDQFIVLILVAWHTLEMFLMATWTAQDKETSAELIELRRRVNIYEEGQYWGELIDMMKLEPRLHVEQRESHSLASPDDPVQES